MAMSRCTSAVKVTQSMMISGGKSILLLRPVTFTALVQRLIAMVQAYQAGSATFWVEGLQLIIAVLLIALGLTIVVNSLRAYFAAKKDSEAAVQTH